MKKIIALMMCLCMALGMFAGCAKDPAETPVVDETVDVKATETLGVEATEEIEESEEMAPPEVIAITEDAIKEAVETNMQKSTDLKEILTNVADSGVIPFPCMVESIPEEFMPGFKNSVKGFSEGAMMVPVISSQPFIVYMFKTADAPKLMEDLKEQADMRWNICTEATVLMCEAYEDVVLFGMLP